MGTVPDVDTVRAYVRVPASSLSDEDLERMRGACLEDQAARCVWDGSEEQSPIVVVDGMSATATIDGVAPGTHCRYSWADGQNGDATADANGHASVTHDYQNAGTYTAVATDDNGNILGQTEVTVPGDGEAPEAYPDALCQALLRRIQREVAARNLPLGMVGLEAEYGPANIPAFDALIEHHEHAYRRVVLA